jgi:hypothetical protein
LFGVQNSPQRRASIFLSMVVVVLGIALFFVRGWEYGLPFVLIGVLSGAVLTRVFAAQHERTETSEQLRRIAGEADDSVAQKLVDHARTDLPPGRVTGEVDDTELGKLRDC